MHAVFLTNNNHQTCKATMSVQQHPTGVAAGGLSQLMQRAHVECSQHAWSMLLVKHCLVLVQHQHCPYLEV